MSVSDGQKTEAAYKGISHRNFDIKTFHNDFAIIRLLWHFHFSSSLTPVCLPSPGQNYEQREVITTGAVHHHQCQVQMTRHLLLLGTNHLHHDLCQKDGEGFLPRGFWKTIDDSRRSVCWSCVLGLCLCMVQSARSVCKGYISARI